MKGQSDITYSLVDEENQESSYHTVEEESDKQSHSSRPDEDEESVESPARVKRSKNRNKRGESTEEVKRSVKNRKMQKAKANKLRKRIESQKNIKGSKSQRTDLLDRDSPYLDKEIKKIHLAQRNSFFEFAFSIISLLSLGLVNLINNWTRKKLRDRLIYSKIDELEKATTVAVTTHTGKKVHVKLQRKGLYIRNELELDTYVFRYNYQTYYYNDFLGCFQNLKQLRMGEKLPKFLAEYKDGMTDEEATLLQHTLGENCLRLMAPSLPNRIISILSRPAASIKLFSVVVLLQLHYKIYLWFVLGYLIYQIVTEVKAERKMFQDTQAAYYLDEKLMVVRNSKGEIHKKRITDSANLVPGDLIEITDNLVVPADVVLVNGSCIIQDNLKGSKDVTRTKIPIESGIDCTLDEIPMKSLLITGDKVLFTINHVNEGCFGIVVNTGFDTVKGETLRDVQRKKVPNFTYMKDVFVLFSVFTAIALLTALVIVVNERLLRQKVPLSTSIFEICQLLLIAVKPAVPMALFAATAYSVKRLKNKYILTNDSTKLGEVGKAQSILVENDAITADDRQSSGFMLCSNNEEGQPGFEKMITAPQKLIKTMEAIPIAKKYVEACGLCHVVAAVNDNYYGSPLDIDMLKSSGFKVNYRIVDNGNIERVIETKKPGFSSSYRILKHYEALKGHPITTVIVENKEGELYLYSKGEPFAFEQICSKSSVPFTYSSTVAKCANKGYKCTAIGFKKIESIDAARAELEEGIRFIGFYNNKTTIKDTAETSINTLNDINVKSVLLTNDSVYMGLSHARQSGICDSTVYIARTVVVNHVETIAWQRSDKLKESNDLSVSGEQPNIIDADLNTEDILGQPGCTLAVTAKAFKLLMDNDDVVKQAVVDKCRVFSNLRKGDRLFIYNTIKSLSEGQSIVYVTCENGDVDLIRNSEVSISLAACYTSAIHSFSSDTGNFSDVVDILQEGRTSLINRHKNFEFACYFIVLQYFGLILLLTKHTTYAGSQIFFMDILVLLCISYFQSSLGPIKLRKEVPCRSILSHKFISSTATLTAYGVFFMWAVVMLLWRTKFYLSPAWLARTGQYLLKDGNAFYDPFIVFIFFVYLNVRFIISNNTRELLTKRVFENVRFALYMCFLLFISFVLLFCNDLSNKGFKNILKAVFKIPELHGFEVIVVIMSVLMLLGFYLVKWLEKNYIRNWTKKNVKADLDDTIEEDDVALVEDELIVSLREKASAKVSSIEKKSKNSKSSKANARKKEVPPKKPRATKRKPNKAESNANSSIVKIEKKNRPSKKRARR